MGARGELTCWRSVTPQGEFYIWVAPGPLDLAAATSTIDAIFVSALGQAEAAWFESHLTVQSAPYSESELDETAQPIEALVSDEPTPAAWHVGVAVTEPYPVVEITLWNDRTPADVGAAQALVSQYGGIVTLILSDSPPPSPVDASLDRARSGAVGTIPPPRNTGQPPPRQQLPRWDRRLQPSSTAHGDLDRTRRRASEQPSRLHPLSLERRARPQEAQAARYRQPTLRCA